MSDEEKPMEAEPSSKKRKADELTEITETDGGDDKDTGDIDKSADPVKTTDAAEDSAGDGVTPTTKEDAVSSKEVNVEEEKKQNDDNTADNGEIREEKPTEKLPPKVEDAASAKSKNPYDSLKWIVVTNDNIGSHFFFILFAFGVRVGIFMSFPPSLVATEGPTPRSLHPFRIGRGRGV